MIFQFLKVYQNNIAVISKINCSLLYSFLAGFGADTPQQDRGCVATNAPVGRLSGSPVLRQQDGGALPRQGPLQKRESVAEVQSRMGRKFSKIENLWPRDDSCLLCFPSTFLKIFRSFVISPERCSCYGY